MILYEEWKNEAVDSFVLAEFELHVLLWTNWKGSYFSIDTSMLCTSTLDEIVEACRGKNLQQARTDGTTPGTT